MILELGTGKCSYFGGPLDKGVGNQEGLGLIEPADLQDWWFRRLFLGAGRYDNSLGLARNLDPSALYIAMRFAYAGGGDILKTYSREAVRRGIFLLRNPAILNGPVCIAQASDWGPNTDTGRLIDMAPACCKVLNVQTDDLTQVQFVPAS